MEANPWTDQALANDIHAGDLVEARMIAEENSGHGTHKCSCGGTAHYKGGVGAHKCTRCGTLRLPSGKWI